MVGSFDQARSCGCCRHCAMACLSELSGCPKDSKKTKEAEFAEQALFTKHPEMKVDWPADHDFQFFKLEIEDLFLIDWFGGRKPLTLEQYLGHSEMKQIMSMMREIS